VKLCSHCGLRPERRPGASWCRECFLAATRAWRAANRGRLLAARRAAYPRVIDQDREKICRRCGQPFIVEAGRKRWVCWPCRDAVIVKGRNHRSRARRSKPAKHVRLRVLNRDGWICYLCSRPIPRELRWPHPLSGTIDHVIPVSAGGSDREDNLRAAHWGCNEAKGDQLPGIEVWVPAEVLA